MRNRLPLLILAVLILFSTALFSRGITKECNLHRGEDALIKKGIEFMVPDSGGNECIWNFRALKPVDGGCRITYYRDTLDLTHITGVEQSTGYDYYERGDTLVIGRYFNRTLKVTYSVPEPVIRFPFSLGDTLTGEFTARGYYSQSIPLTLSGNTVIAADGQGKLITPDGDTLMNVVRVHTLRSCKLVIKDTLNILHDKYAWYASGFRYPVFETITTKYIKADNGEVPHMGVSFYYSPEKQVEHLAEDLANDSVWNKMQADLAAVADSIKLVNQKASDSVGLVQSYIVENLKLYPIPAVTMLTADFTLKRSATVSVELYDRSFRKLRVIDMGTVPEGDRRETVDVSALPPGMYHIHFVFSGEPVKMAFVKGI